MKKNLRRPLAYYGNPILRKKADPVESITPEISRLIQDMIAMLDQLGHSVGLAAPQVNVSLSLFVARAPVEDVAEAYEGIEAKVFINPEILSFGKETWKRGEGCFSIPGVFDEVERPWRIRVKYQDETGKSHEEDFEGMIARVIQHEYDHLQGVLMIDRF